MKHVIITTKQGYAAKKRDKRILDWSYLAKRFPLYKEHIFRIRRNYEKLINLTNKLCIKYKVEL